MHGLSPDEELSYWRERASAAERELAAAQDALEITARSRDRNREKLDEAHAQLATTRAALNELADLAESLRPSALSASEWPETERIATLRAKAEP